MATSLHSDSRRRYSWWWDSHISPKNSKWLQENLKDMDAKVKTMIKLIEEDADSFARRAEMYYKKRPELMKLVEELYRAYRALAERYDHATGELRHAHRTMAEAFPDQIPFVLAEDSPLGSSAHVTEPHSQGMPHPMLALLEPDDLHKSAVGLSALETKKGPSSRKSDTGINERGLKQFHELFGAGEVPKNSSFAEGRVNTGLNHETAEREQNLRNEVSDLSNENQNLKAKVLSESERAGKAESEVENLKKALVDMQAETEAVLLQYQRCLEKLSRLEGELNCSQKDYMELSEQARKAETEVQTLKETQVKLEAERDGCFIKHKECLEKNFNLEDVVSQAQEDSKGLSERAIKAEIESQYLKTERSSLESEKEARLLEYKKCLVKISDLERNFSVAKEDARLLNDRADGAETEVENLKKALTKLNEEKDIATIKFQHCLEKISKLEAELSCAQEHVKNLNSEILIGSAQLKNAEEKSYLLERSNKSLLIEADSLAKKIAMKDRELSEKHEELEKLQMFAQDEHLRYEQVEATLRTLQNLHSQSHEEHRALALELKDGIQMIKDLEICKYGLEEELQRVKDENQRLNGVNSSSTISMKSLQNELLSLREMKERLEEEVSVQMDRSNSLEQEICCLKEEFQGLNRSYRAVIKQVESVGLNPEHIGSSIKELQDENSRLRQICETDRNEKAVIFKKLEKTDELLQKNALLERSVSNVNCELEGSREKVRELQESCQLLQGEKSTLVAEKTALLSQLLIIMVNMQKIMEKNILLEDSLSGANAELQGLREKSKSLEDICQLLKNEKFNLVTERDSLVVQVERIVQRLEDLEKRFSGLDEKYAGLEKEKKSTHSQVEQLRICLGVEKQDRESLALSSETRLASLEHRINVLQEESRWRKKEFEEVDKAVNSQFEIFVLKKFMQDMEEKNRALLIECQKHAEVSKLTEKLISELESENLEQQMESELLLDEIEKLRLGIYQVFKALETGSDNGSEDKIENEQISVHHIVENIEKMKCSLSKYENDNQQLLVESSVLLTLIEQMKLEGTEVESEKNILDLDFKIMTEQLFIMQNDERALVEMNKLLRKELSKGYEQANVLKTEVDDLCVKQGDLQRAYVELEEKYSQALEENKSLLKKISDVKEEKFMVDEENDFMVLETLALGSLSMICKCFGTEKAAELESLSQDLHNLHGFHDVLEKEVGILRGKLEMKESEILLLKNTVERLEMELDGVKEFNNQLKQEISSENDALTQMEAQLSEAEQKLKATENLNFELCKTIEGLKRECEESRLMRDTIEKQIVVLSEDNTSQKKEVEWLREDKGNLLAELSTTREEIEERRKREVNMSSELREKNNDRELWEAEAAGFYFDLQISSIHEVLLENKVHELTGVCEILEDESSSKTFEIEQMKERVSFMESELEGLKGQLSAYAPVIVSLGDHVASLEHNILSQTKPNIADNWEAKNPEDAFYPHEKICQELVGDEPSPTPNAILDLHKLQNKIKAVEKVSVEAMNKLVMQESVSNIKLEAAMREIQELKSQCSLGQGGKDKEENGLAHEPSHNLKVKITKTKISEGRKGTLMKDIPLDHVSDGSLYRISRRVIGRADDQLLELWETAEEDYSYDPTSKISQKQAYEQTESDMEPRSEYPSSELQVEKELGVDRLEVSTSVTEPNLRRSRKILERLASDAQKLASLQITVEDLRRKMETNKKRKSKDFDFETVKEQLQEVNETVVQLVNLNGLLKKNVQQNCLKSDEKSSAELDEAVNVQRKRVSEEARKGTEKIGRLQLEVQKIQCVMLKLEDEKKGKGKIRFARIRATIILRDFIYSGRRSIRRRKKAHLCGCFRASTNGDGNHI